MCCVTAAGNDAGTVVCLCLCVHDALCNSTIWGVAAHSLFQALWPVGAFP